MMRVRIDQNFSRGSSFPKALKSATCGPSLHVTRKICPRSTTNALPVRAGISTVWVCLRGRFAISAYDARCPSLSRNGEPLVRGTDSGLEGSLDMDVTDPCATDCEEQSRTVPPVDMA